MHTLEGRSASLSSRNKNGMEGLVLPAENAREAAVVDGLSVFPARTLPQVAGFLKGSLDISPEFGESPKPGGSPDSTDDFSDIRGQHHAKRALEVAAAGSHNLLMLCSPAKSHPN